MNVFNYINKTSKLTRKKKSEKIVSFDKTYCTLVSMGAFI